MVLRMVLVGVVAGLGLTLPGRRDLESWGHSAECWVNARLAAWDAQTPTEEPAFVFIAEPEVPTIAEPVVPVVPDNDFAAIVDDQAVAFAREQTLSPASETDKLVRDASVEAPAAVSEVLAIALPTEPAPAEAEAASDSSVAFETAIDEIVIELATGSAARPEVVSDSSVAFETVMDEVVVELTAVTAAPEAVQGDQEFLAVVEEMAASFSTEAPRLAEATEGARPVDPSFEPMEVGDDLYLGEAYALNREAEGITTPAPTPAPETENVDRLTNAVRLTREAVFAWASLLHGPAVVTISR